MSAGSVLAAGALEWGIALPPETLARFDEYCAFLREKNEVMDLTAVLEEEEIARRHFLDSLSLMTLASFARARVLDVGSGAGFPGLPLKLAEPSLELTLLDAQGKRVDFLRELTQRLGTEAACLHARAEEQALLPGYRDGYDFVLSRAVARLNVLCELCLPFVKPGGAFLAMKSRDSDEELREAERAIRRLGGAPEEVRELTVAGVPRRVAVIRKERPTPKGYPRRFAKIKKEPL